MRTAHSTTRDEILRNYLKQGTYRKLAYALGLPLSYIPTLSRIKRGAPGVSFDKEAEVRRRLFLPPLPQETLSYDPRTHRCVPRGKPRKRAAAYRPYLPTEAGVLIRMEAARRGITPAALILGALGIEK